MSDGTDLEAVGDDRRDVVFLSYSHDDAEWAQAFTTFLKPLVRRKRLRLWVDTANNGFGEQWHPEIGRAIGQSQVALVLVSARFLGGVALTALTSLLTARLTVNSQRAAADSQRLHEARNQLRDERRAAFVAPKSIAVDRSAVISSSW